VSEHHEARPVQRKLFTPGVCVLLVLAAIGLCVAAWRFVFGLSSVTHLDQQHPWGLWIAFDVASGVALAAGGFTTAALVHIFHREHYHAIVRPALLTAMLGYTFVGLGLMVDLGRYYNIWHPAMPWMWSGHSVLFEVGICVMCYLTVLYIEFLPILCERFIGADRWPRLQRACTAVHGVAGKVMFLFVIAGVVLSCAHQSSLGNLMVLTPAKMHPLWWTPILSMLFLLSAIAVGFPMVTFESMYASWALKLKPEMNVLSPLARIMPVLLGVYLLAKVTDMVVRGTYVYLGDGSVQSTMFIVEVLFGVIVPFVMLLSARVRSTPRWLFVACLLVVLGVALNRIDVFLVAFQPLYPVKSYFPAITEFLVSIGLVALLMFIYRVIVTYFPVIAHPAEVVAQPAEAEDDRSARFRRGRLPRRHLGEACVALLTFSLVAGTAWADRTQSQWPPAGRQPPEAAQTPTTQPVPAAKPQMDLSRLECGTCHSCQNPREEAPCLRMCPRNVAEDIVKAAHETLPGDTILLNAFEWGKRRFMPVPFPHKLHSNMVGMAGGCETCHHHTAKGRLHPPCRECHKPAYAKTEPVDMRMPSLKGAYHRQCMGCHRDWSHSTKCGICHLPKGDQEEPVRPEQVLASDDVAHHPPIESPTDVHYKTDNEAGPNVMFRHRDHIERYGYECARCHRKENCSRCHEQAQKPAAQLHTVRDVTHDACFTCHGEDRCERCHSKEENPAPKRFDHSTTGFVLSKYHSNLTCRACHKRLFFLKKLQGNCQFCHKDWDPDTFDHAKVTGLALNETHAELECSECHTDKTFVSPPTCSGCHDEDVKYPDQLPGTRVGPALATPRS
jgi:Ni/Fe-hydrogenase subunit HybB-like protein